MLSKRNLWITDDVKVEVVTWSGNRNDEGELRAICGDQLHYVRDDGVAAIGRPGVALSDSFVAAGDYVIADANTDQPVLWLPGGHWLVQEMFGPGAPEVQPGA
jgi:hypothetical protein